ncbi:signal peptide peptidase SppA [Desulfofustis glycolicus]|nr:signal peptide peptidase SppA [Desulfofustis glycolicus]MCB2218369.1 signal peptide peptidase SppA [Desulfobulbaceae bacterium]
MKDFFVSIFNIFKVLAKILGTLWTIVFNLLFFGGIALLAVTLFRSTETVIPLDSILKLTLSGTIVEQQQDAAPIDGYLSEFLGFSDQPRETLLQDVLDVLDQAADDDSIVALVLDLESFDGAGLNQLQEIGAALTRFRQSGKQVIAAEDYYTQSQYYLAAHADTVLLNPMGGVNLSGFSVYRFYFQELLDKLNIRFHVFQVGDYKSATEPLTRSSMSPEDRSQSRAWLTDLWAQYLDDVADQRDLQPEAITAYINRIPDNLREVGGDLARLALDSGLVDRLSHRHETSSYLATLTDSTTDGSPRMVSFTTYLKTVDPSYRGAAEEQPEIALIVAQGAIMPGRSSTGTIGADTITSLLQQARTTPAVKGVVLRIDSGGGSAFASEMIRQELLQLKQAGKPVVVSMGSMAASGAYWLAADADEIWAAPSTITGSIGIFMALPTFDESLARLGIRRDGIGTTNLSGGLDLSRPLAPEIKEAIELTLENGYRKFRSIVAEGRGMTEETVEGLAQGKVYSGIAARDIGLVDQLGDLDQAIKAAAAKAGLGNYAVTTLTEPLSLREQLFRRIGSESRAAALQSPLLTGLTGLIRDIEPAAEQLLLFNDPNGLNAHCMLQLFPSPGIIPSAIR